MVERIHTSYFNKQSMTNIVTKSLYIQKLLRYLRIYKLYLKKHDISHIKNKNLIEKISEDYIKLEYNRDLLLILLYISVTFNIYVVLMQLFLMYENGVIIHNNTNTNTITDHSLLFYHDVYKSYNTCNSNYIE